MAYIRLNFLAAILAVCLIEIHGHGKMVDPLNRSSLWRSVRYRGAPDNYNDNENFCGGQVVQHDQNRGRCGPCGDNYRDPVPRENENGGTYGNGIIVKRYKAGEKIKVAIDLTVNHLGYFEFNICELKNEEDVETEECFNKHPLQLVDENGEIGYKYYAGSDTGLYKVQVFLPEGCTCEHCVLRWHYRTGNNWGMCEDGEYGTGCADDAEVFRSCADITILPFYYF